MCAVLAYFLPLLMDAAAKMNMPACSKQTEQMRAVARCWDEGFAIACSEVARTRALLQQTIEYMSTGKIVEKRLLDDHSE